MDSTYLNSDQTKIYQGLMSIGPEIAFLYKDAVEISNSSVLQSKPYLLGHLSREIEAGLRDILVQKQTSIECKSCGRKWSSISHRQSIMLALGLEKENELSELWSRTATEFHSYAHRHGAWKNPRGIKSFDPLWSDFQKVLLKLVGNYYHLIDRFDSSLLGMSIPDASVLGAIKNLFENETIRQYFFSNLKEPSWLKPLYDAGYFKGSDNPEPIEDNKDQGFYFIPYWDVLSYLTKVAEFNSKEPNDSITKLLRVIFNDITNYRKDNGQRIINFRTDYCMFLLICHSPTPLGQDQFEYIHSILDATKSDQIAFKFNKLIERIIEKPNKEEFQWCFRLLFGIRTKAANEGKISSYFESYQLQRHLGKFKNALIEIYGEVLLDEALVLAFRLMKISKGHFSTLYLPAIEDHSQTRFEDRLEIQLTYLIRDSLESLPSEILKKRIPEFLQQENEFFHRIAFHIIRLQYNDLSEFFWKQTNPIVSSTTKHEVYELIRNHCQTFSKNQIQILIDWIDNADFYIHEDFQGDKEKYLAFRRKEWFTALEPLKNSEVMEKVTALNQIEDSKIEHPEFNSYSSSWSGEQSPVSLDELSTMSISEISDYFEQFKIQDHEFMGPSIGGFTGVLSKHIETKPNQYTSFSPELINADHAIKYSWIYGLENAYRDSENKFDPNETFKILIEILSNKKFWDDYSTNNNYCSWFVIQTLRFMELGLRHDPTAIDSKYLPEIKSIYFLILENDHNFITHQSDVATTALNNSIGITYSGLMQFSLRKARLKLEENRWDIDIKNFISNKLQESTEDPLFYHTLGQFLPNIHYLNESWLEENFSLIFSETSDINWSAAMSGYFFYNRQVYNKYFQWFLGGNHLRKSLSFDFGRDEIKQHIVEMILIAYLNEFEGTKLDDDSIMDSLMKSMDSTVTSELIYFFWSPKSKLPTKLAIRIKPLWFKIVDVAMNVQNLKMLSGSCKWVNTCPFDADVFQILKKCIPYLEDSDSYAVIDGLLLIVEEHPEEVGVVLLEMFRSKKISEWINEDEIQTLVRTLYKKDKKELADMICIKCGEQGFYYLRDIFNDHQ